MSKLLCFWVCCFLFISCADKSKEETGELPPSKKPVHLMNLLENGDCEKWYAGMDGDYLYGWSAKETQRTLFQESKIVCEGDFSAKLHSYQAGITAFISQKINVAPGHHIRIYFHFFLTSFSGTAPRMYCYFRESASGNRISNEILGEIYDENTLGIIRGGGYGLKHFPTCEGEWQVFDYTIQVPAIARYFVFEIHSYVGTTLYVDDCYVVDIDM